MKGACFRFKLEAVGGNSAGTSGQHERGHVKQRDGANTCQQRGISSPVSDGGWN